MKNRTIIGIDPGKDGGVAMMADGVVLECMVMPDSTNGIFRLLNGNDSLEFFGADLCVLELVHAMPGQGVVSMFSFGKHYGEIIGVLTALSIPYQLVTPQRWKKVVLEGLNWKGDKEAAVRYVQAKYPDLELPKNKKKRSGIADAICIAEFGRLQNKEVK